MRESVLLEGVLLHSLEVALTAQNDVGDVLRFRSRVRQLKKEFSSPMSPGISSHRGPGTVPVEQPQQAVPPGLGGSDGGGLCDFCC